MGSKPGVVILCSSLPRRAGGGSEGNLCEGGDNDMKGGRPRNESSGAALLNVKLVGEQVFEIALREVAREPFLAEHVRNRLRLALL